MELDNRERRVLNVLVDRGDRWGTTLAVAAAAGFDATHSISGVLASLERRGLVESISTRSQWRNTRAAKQWRVVAGVERVEVDVRPGGSLSIAQLRADAATIAAVEVLGTPKTSDVQRHTKLTATATLEALGRHLAAGRVTRTAGERPATGGQRPWIWRLA